MLAMRERVALGEVSEETTAAYSFAMVMPADALLGPSARASVTTYYASPTSPRTSPEPPTASSNSSPGRRRFCVLSPRSCCASMAAGRTLFPVGLMRSGGRKSGRVASRSLYYRRFPQHDPCAAFCQLASQRPALVANYEGVRVVVAQRVVDDLLVTRMACKAREELRKMVARTTMQRTVGRRESGDINGEFVALEVCRRQTPTTVARGILGDLAWFRRDVSVEVVLILDSF